MKSTTRIEIDPKSLLFTIGILIILFVAWQIRGVLIALFVAFILMSGFAPLVDRLTSRGVPKTLSVALTYLLAIGFLATLLFFVIPPMIVQTSEFVSKLPSYINDLSSIVRTVDTDASRVFTVENVANILASRVEGALSNLLAVVLNAFSLVLSFITVAVFSFYLLLEREKIKKILPKFFSNIPKHRIESLVERMEVKLGAWLRGEALLMLIIGVATYIGLTILGVDYALPLAVIAGLLELVPTIGPIISSIPAIIIAFVQGPILAIAVASLYVLIQQAENNIIVPKVMERAVGLSPLVVIFSLLVGGTLFGIVGAILAVPAAAIIHVIAEEFLEDS